MTVAPSTLGGALTGTGASGLIKEGPGILVLNVANSYSGNTTITAGTLRIAATDRLGSANNTLIFNGGTLQAGGAISSPATRGVTMTQTGIFDTNSHSISIAGIVSGAGGLTKNGAGTLTLSGSNGYLGNTTLNAGTLSVGSSANLGNAASNLVFNGGTLQVTGTTLNDLADLGRTVNFTSGQTVGLDIADAGNVFTPGQVLNQGTGGLTKAGAGTLVLNQAHTYTGVTTISSGTLRLDVGGSLATRGVINNSVYLINQNAATGSAPLTNIIGTGAIGAGPSATLTVNSATGLSANAIATSGGGSFALSGVTTPTFGGLVGTTGTLSSSFSSGYSGVTNLTLDTNGNSFTYGGVIDDGAAGMDLTKADAGTQTLTGGNTYTGDTFFNGGTISLSGTAGALRNTTGLSFNGGGLTLTSADSVDEDDFDRVNDSAPITSNGGTITYTTTTAASTKNFIETTGSVALTSGQLNLVNTLDKSAGSQTLALGGLTQAGSAAITFSNAGGLNTTTDRIRVNGITVDTAADTIIGPWATVGTSAAAQTDYAVYDSDGTNGFVIGRNTAGSAETTWTTAGNAYTNALAAQTLTATRTITALRNTGTTATLTLASGANLETYGLLNGVATAFTVAPGTGGVLTTPAGGGSLHVNAGSAAITVSAPVNDNSGAVALVKNGSGSLFLSSTTSNYSGGTVINAGTVVVRSADTNLGAAGTAITFNGSGALSYGTQSSSGASATLNLGSRPITLNDGAIAGLYYNEANKIITVSGAITGSGGIVLGRDPVNTFSGGSGFANYNLLSNSNTFTGPLTIGLGTENIGVGSTITINSLADSTSPIISNYGNGATITLGASATADLSVPNRPLDLRNGSSTFTNSNATRTMTLGAVSTTTSGAKTLNLGNSGFGGSIAGAVTDGAGQIAVTKTGSGTWKLTGANTYTGTTTVSAGTLQIGDAGTTGSLAASSPITGSASATLAFNRTDDYGGGFANNIAGAMNVSQLGSGSLRFTGSNTYTGTTTVTAGVLQFATPASLYNSGTANWVTAKINVKSNATFSLNVGGAGEFTDANVGTLLTNLASSTSAATGMNAGSRYGFDTTNATGGTFTLTGTLANSTGGSGGARGLTKLGSGTLALAAPNTFTGPTTVAAGVLQIGAGGATGSLSDSSAVSVSSGATLAFNRSNDLTYGGTVSGAGGGLTKLGTGKLTLTAASTYTGPTTISSGTLALGAAGSFADSGSIVVGDAGSSGAVLDLSAKSSLTIGSGQTLTGIGTTLLGPTTTLLVSGTFSPGNSPGLFTFAGGSTTLAGTTLMEITGSSRGVPGGYDAVNVTNSGLLTLGGSLTLDFSQSFADNTVFDLFSTLSSGSLAGAFGSVTSSGSFYAGTWSAVGSGTFQLVSGPQTLTFSSSTGDIVIVPEPATLALVGIGLAAIGWRLRSRRRHG